MKDWTQAETHRIEKVSSYRTLPPSGKQHDRKRKADIDQRIWDSLFKERTPPTFHEEAACRGMDHNLFFPDKDSTLTRDQGPFVRETCGGCPVRAECLQWAIDNDERFGVRGGIPERLRARYSTEGLTTAEEMIERIDAEMPPDRSRGA